MVQSYLKIKPRTKKFQAPKVGDYEQFVDDLENFPGAVRKVKYGV